MPNVEQQITVLCQSMLGKLARDTKLADDSVLPAGSVVLILPNTVADCVLTPEGESLAKAWPSLSRTGHAHQELADLGGEMIRFSGRIADAEISIISQAESIVRQASSLASARTRLEELAAQIGPQSANTIAVISDPEFELADYIENKGEISFSAAAESLLKSGRIAGFHLSIPELAIFAQEFPAENGAATVSFTPFAYMSNQELHISVTAVDNYGNKSRIARKVITLVIYGIQPPLVVSPQDGETLESLTPNIVLADMEVMGELEDKPKYVRLQIALDADFAQLVYDNGVASAPNADNIIPIPEKLEAGRQYFARARWTGEVNGESPWSKTVSFFTEGENNE